MKGKTPVKAADSSGKVFAILQKKEDEEVWLEGAESEQTLALEATERFQAEKRRSTWSRDQGKIR